MIARQILFTSLTTFNFFVSTICDSNQSANTNILPVKDVSLFFFPPDQPITIIKDFQIPACRSLDKDDNSLTPVLTSLHIWRPKTIEGQDTAFLLTSYVRTTSCSTNLFGMEEKERLTDVPQNLADVDPIFLGRTEVELKKADPKILAKTPISDVLSVNTAYDCQYWKSGKQLVSYSVLKIKIMTVQWASDNTLISPLRKSDCLTSNETCYMSEHSRLYLKSTSQTGIGKTCNLEKIATLQGWVFGAPDSSSVMRLTNFISASARVQFKIMASFEQLKNPLCMISEEEFVFSTQDGLLFSFELIDEMSPLEILLTKNNLPPVSRYRLGSILVVKFRHEKMRSMEYRMRRSGTSSMTPMRSQLYIRERRSTSDETSRGEDYSLSGIPNEFRANWLFEHELWDKASNEWNFNVLKNATLEFNHQVLSSQCKSWHLNLMITRAILDVDYRPYLMTFLGSHNFLGYYKDQTLFYQTGIPLYTAEVLKPYKFCNGSVEILVELFGKKSRGFLRQESGVIKGATTGDTCVSTESPIRFLIPLRGNGSLDIISNTWTSLSPRDSETLSIVLNEESVSNLYSRQDTSEFLKREFDNMEIQMSNQKGIMGQTKEDSWTDIFYPFEYGRLKTSSWLKWIWPAIPFLLMIFLISCLMKPIFSLLESCDHILSDHDH